MSLTPLPSTRKIIQPCLPGKYEIGYLAKAFALMIMCPALVRLTGKFHYKTYKVANKTKNWPYLKKYSNKLSMKALVEEKILMKNKKKR